MGKGKKERSKKNKNKKETREPIKRKFEDKKNYVPTHPPSVDQDHLKHTLEHIDMLVAGIASRAHRRAMRRKCLEIKFMFGN